MRRAFIAIEIVVLVLFVLLIISRKNGTSGASFALTPQNFTHNASSTYEYYIEPIASTTIRNKQPWAAVESINTINADTLNERFNYTVTKTPGTFRIALLGDSFAFGLYVNTQSNFSELLEDDLNKNLNCPAIKKIELINFGVPSYDLQYEVERYRLRAAKYNPDLVLWLVESGDFTLVDETFNKDEKKYLQGKNVDPNDAWKVARAEYATQISQEDAVKAEISAIPVFNTLYKGPLVVFSLPPLFDTPQSNVVKSLTAAFAARPKTLVDLSMAAPWTVEDQVLPDDAHPNEKGSMRLEQALLAYIQKQQLVPCNPSTNLKAGVHQ